jgi:hypothetical protein
VPPILREKLATAVDDDERARINARLNDLNARIMHSVQRGGRAYLSNATLGGRYALRACITNFRTTSNDILETRETVRDAASDL